VILDDDDALAAFDTLLASDGIGVKRLASAADGHHHFADRLGGDGTGHAADLSDDVLIEIHVTPPGYATRRATAGYTAAREVAMMTFAGAPDDRDGQAGKRKQRSPRFAEWRSRGLLFD